MNAFAGPAKSRNQPVGAPAKILVVVLFFALSGAVPVVVGFFSDPSEPQSSGVSPRNLAHRNRSDFCDLRLQCPSQTPEIAAISEPRENIAALRFKGAMESC